MHNSFRWGCSFRVEWRWMLLLAMIHSAASAEAIPTAPVFAEIVYPPETITAPDGKPVPGTGAKPGEVLTLKGEALRDPAPQNPRPTKVTFTIPDPADATRTKPYEVDPNEIATDAKSLKVTIPAAALAGAVRVQWGAGDTAIQSQPQTANIRFAGLKLLPGTLDEYQYFNSSTTDTQVFFPDNRLAWKGEVSGYSALQCLAYNQRAVPEQQLPASTMKLANPGAQTLAAGTDCSAAGDPWYGAW